VYALAPETVVFAAAPTELASFPAILPGREVSSIRSRLDAGGPRPVLKSYAHYMPWSVIASAAFPGGPVSANSPSVRRRVARVLRVGTCSNAQPVTHRTSCARHAVIAGSSISATADVTDFACL